MFISILDSSLRDSSVTYFNVTEASRDRANISMSFFEDYVTRFFDDENLDNPFYCVSPYNFL